MCQLQLFLIDTDYYFVVILFVQLKAEEVVAFAFAHHLAADALAFFTLAATEHLDVRELPFNREGEGLYSFKAIHVVNYRELFVIGFGVTFTPRLFLLHRSTTF